MRSKKSNKQPEQPELFPGLLEKLDREKPIAQEDLIGQGAIAREKRKKKKRLAAPAARSRSPVAAAGEELRSRDSRTNPPIPAETPEQTPEQAERGDNGRRSPDSRTNLEPQPETLEQASMLDSTPDPPEQMLKSCSRVSDAAETLEQPQAQAGEGVEQNQNCGEANLYPIPTETLEQTSMARSDPPDSEFVLESRARDETPEQIPAAENKGGAASPGESAAKSVLESLPPANETPEQIGSPEVPDAAPDSPEKFVLESRARDGTPEQIPLANEQRDRDHSELEDEMNEFPPIHPEAHRSWIAKGWFAAQYKWIDETGQHTSDKYPTVPCGVRVYGPYVTFCYHREGTTDKREYLGKPCGFKYRNFIRHWKQCSGVEEAIAFFEKSSPDAAIDG